MKINAISNAEPQVQNFTSRRYSNENQNIDNQEKYVPLSDHRVRNTLRALALTPLFMVPVINSCDNGTKITEDGESIVIIFQEPDKCNCSVPIASDTLYHGHVYDLNMFKQPLVDSLGNTTGSVIIPPTKAFIPLSLDGNAVQPVMEKMFKFLGVKSEGIEPFAGKRKAFSEGLPLQLVFSNSANQKVSNIRLDGFNSSLSTFVYNSTEYNKNGLPYGDYHYELTYSDDNTLFVEKSDNVYPEKPVEKYMYRLENNKLNKYKQLSGDEYQLIGNFAPDSKNSVFFDSDNKSSLINNITLRESSL